MGHWVLGSIHEVVTLVAASQFVLLHHLMWGIAASCHDLLALCRIWSFAGPVCANFIHQNLILWFPHRDFVDATFWVCTHQFNKKCRGLNRKALYCSNGYYPKDNAYKYEKDGCKLVLFIYLIYRKCFNGILIYFLPLISKLFFYFPWDWKIQGIKPCLAQHSGKEPPNQKLQPP